MRTKNKYFIAGSSGFIGSHLTRRLHQENEEVYALVRRNSNLWRIEDLSDLKIIEGDVTNYKNLLKQIKKVEPTHIINLATYGVYRDQKNSQKIIEVNLQGSQNLFNAARELSNLQLFINTGSVYEYGNLPGQMEESNVAQARNFYDAVKISTTALAQAYTSLDILPICTLRPFTVYGPYEDKSRLVSSVVSTIKKGKAPRIAPNAIRDFIYIEDLIDGYMKVLKSSQKITGEIINFGSGCPTKVKDFVSIIIDELDSDLKPIKAPKFSSAQDSRCWANIKKAQKLLNWSPQTGNKEGISKTIAWLLK